MEDAETGLNKWVDTSSAMVRYNYQQHFFKQTEIAKRHFMKAGAELLHIRTDEDYVKILQQFFFKKKINLLVYPDEHPATDIPRNKYCFYN